MERMRDGSSISSALSSAGCSSASGYSDEDSVSGSDCENYEKGSPVTKKGKMTDQERIIRWYDKLSS
jgi:hypothetical protein